MFDIFSQLSPFMKNVIVVYFMLNLSVGLILFGYIILIILRRLRECNIKSIDISLGNIVKADIETNDGVKK